MLQLPKLNTKQQQVTNNNEAANSILTTDASARRLASRQRVQAAKKGAGHGVSRSANFVFTEVPQMPYTFCHMLLTRAHFASNTIHVAT